MSPGKRTTMKTTQGKHCDICLLREAAQLEISAHASGLDVCTDAECQAIREATTPLAPPPDPAFYARALELRIARVRQVRFVERVTDALHTGDMASRILRVSKGGA